jgi:hypothetical protein
MVTKISRKGMGITESMIVNTTVQIALVTSKITLAI